MHATVICRERERCCIQTKNADSPSSYVSIAMSLVGIVEDKLTNSTACGAFVLFILSLFPSRYFFSFGKLVCCTPENVHMFQPSAMSDHVFPSGTSFNVKDKIPDILTETRKWNFLLVWKRKPLNLVYSIVA